MTTKLAQIETFDRNDLTSTGETVTLYADGRISVESRSRWQGSRDGRRWVTAPDYLDVAKVSQSDPDSDAEALLTAWVARYDWLGLEDDEDFRQTRAGTLVR